MKESITSERPEILAASEREISFLVPSYTDRGLSQISIETTPADARVWITGGAGGKITVQRQQSERREIVISWRIRYGDDKRDA